MKKIIATALLMASLGCLSSFGQGCTFFSAAKSSVGNGLTVPNLIPNLSAPAAYVNTVFLRGSSGDVPVAEIAAAWAEILNEPTYTLAGHSSSSSVVVAKTRSGALSSSNYSTPQLAAAASMAVGLVTVF